MPANSIPFLSPVYMTSPSPFLEEGSTETFIRCIKNASELFFSTPFASSYVDQGWQFAKAPNESFRIGASATLWFLFTSIARYQGVTRSILLLGICVLPKIYNRYNNYSSVNLSKFQSPAEKMRQKLETTADLSDKLLSEIVLFSLKMEEPYIAEKTLNKHWDRPAEKDKARSALISYFLRKNNFPAAERIAFTQTDSKTAPLADLITLFKYLLEIDPLSAEGFRIKHVSLGLWLVDYCLIHSAINYKNLATATKDPTLVDEYNKKANADMNLVRGRTSADRQGERKLAVTALGHLEKNQLKEALDCIERADFTANHPLTQLK